MTPKEFEVQYMGAWKPDPMLEECIAFMRYATEKERRDYIRAGLFSAGHVRAAKRIIDSEHAQSRQIVVKAVVSPDWEV